MIGPLEAVTLCLGYPGPGSLEALESAVDRLPAGSARSGIEAFLAEVSQLDLGQWEELHTETLDLSPRFVPYVGHVVWGESYRRGAFMADLQRAQIEVGVDQRGELPDHLVPVLGYLAAVEEPLEELADVLPQALAAMRRELKRSDADNPYRHVLEAAAAAADARLGEGAAA